MERLVLKLKRDNPNLLFSPGQAHCWSPEQGQILYENSKKSHNVEGLLHELGHARMGHSGYSSDMELLQKEVEAWQEAVKLARMYAVTFDEEHIQDCLDTYREWIYKRSMCPKCQSTGAQKDEVHYHCLNCDHAWRVTASRFCRPYRRSKPVKA